MAKTRHQYFTLGDKTVPWKTIKAGDKDRHTMQKRLAHDLLKKAGLSQFNGPWSYHHFQQIQKVLVKEGFQLKVFSHDDYKERGERSNFLPRIIMAGKHLQVESTFDRTLIVAELSLSLPELSTIGK